MASVCVNRLDQLSFELLFSRAANDQRISRGNQQSIRGVLIKS